MPSENQKLKLEKIIKRQGDTYEEIFAKPRLSFDDIASDKNHFDWWIFPSSSQRTPEYSVNQKEDEGKAVFLELSQNADYCKKYVDCLEKFITIFRKRQPSEIVNIARFAKVFESFTGMTDGGKRLMKGVSQEKQNELFTLLRGLYKANNDVVKSLGDWNINFLKIVRKKAIEIELSSLMSGEARSGRGAASSSVAAASAASGYRSKHRTRRTLPAAPSRSSAASGAAASASGYRPDYGASASAASASGASASAAAASAASAPSQTVIKKELLQSKYQEFLSVLEQRKSKFPYRNNHNNGLSHFEYGEGRSADLPSAESIDQDISIKKAPRISDREFVSIMRKKQIYPPFEESGFQNVKLFSKARDARKVYDVNFGNRQNYGGFVLKLPDKGAQEEGKAVRSAASLTLAYMHQVFDRDKDGAPDLELGDFDLYDERGKIASGRPLVIEGQKFLDERNPARYFEVCELAMAAPKIDGNNSRPSQNTVDSAKYLFLTAYNGFKLCKDSNPDEETVVRSGLWGAGAFQNSPHISMAMQILAARSAGVDLILSSRYSSHQIDFFKKEILPTVNDLLGFEIPIEDKILNIFEICREKDGRNGYESSFNTPSTASALARSSSLVPQYTSHEV